MLGNTVQRGETADLIARLQADGAPIVQSSGRIDGGSLDGWHIIEGGESMPGTIVWKPGEYHAFVWHPRCGPTDAGHELHRWSIPLLYRPRAWSDVVASFVEDPDAPDWIIDSIRKMI